MCAGTLAEDRFRALLRRLNLARYSTFWFELHTVTGLALCSKGAKSGSACLRVNSQHSLFRVTRAVLEIPFLQVGKPGERVALLLHGWPDDATTWLTRMSIVLTVLSRA
jgi:hypothetical protein